MCDHYTHWTKQGGGGGGSERCISAYHHSSRPPTKHHSSGSFSPVEEKLGGFWYSTPLAGRCLPGAKPGDGSGCTWRVKTLVKQINASCIGALVRFALPVISVSQLQHPRGAVASRLALV